MTMTITMTTAALAEQLAGAKRFYGELDRYDSGNRFAAYREALCEVFGADFVREANAMAMKAMNKEGK